MTYKKARNVRAIDPEVLPPQGSTRYRAISGLPKWALFGGAAATVLFATSSARALFPVICLGLVAGLALKKAEKFN